MPRGGGLSPIYVLGIAWAMVGIHMAAQGVYAPAFAWWRYAIGALASSYCACSCWFRRA